jgi:HPt (histidine-containing phosphotransfer) domain-containing protein
MDDHVATPLTMDDLDRIVVRWVPEPGGDVIDDGAEDPPLDGIDLLVSEIGSDQVRRMFATWKEDTPRRRAAMRTGIDSHDAKAVADAAHQLKSTCGLFGAREAAQTAAQAEDLARRGDESDLPAICIRFEDEVSRAVTAVEARLSAFASSRGVAGLGSAQSPGRPVPARDGVRTGRAS